MDWNRYLPPQKEIWQGRPESIHERVQCIDLRSQPLEKGAYALIGFACDEGIRRNQGRPGAVEGPKAFRDRLGRLYTQKEFSLLDLGDVTCLDGNLEASQAMLGKVVAHCYREGLFPFVVGGGHELAWGHYLGIPHERCGILNIDAHFDLRPGRASSGTSFEQMAQDRRQHGLPFDYFAIGLQSHANALSLFNRARELGVRYVIAHEPHEDALKEFLAHNEKIYLSICLDVFAAAFAPGVSAPQSLGLSPDIVLRVIDQVASRCVAFHIAELSPPLDQDNRTAQLAAHLFLRWVPDTNKTMRPQC